MIKISASQINLKRRCERAYIFQYIDGFIPEPTEKQKFGELGHLYLECYLRSNTLIPSDSAGRTAHQAVEKGLLPIGGDNRLLVEHFFTYPFCKDVELTGIIDFIEPFAQRINDHKFTSSTRWMLTPDQLRLDSQTIMYALWAMLTFQWSEIHMRWIYYIATNPENGSERQPNGVHPVEIDLSNKDVRFLASIDKLQQDVERIVELKTPGKRIFALDFPPSPGACSAYGGCPHQKRCNLSVLERLE